MLKFYIYKIGIMLFEKEFFFLVLFTSLSNPGKKIKYLEIVKTFYVWLIHQAQLNFLCTPLDGVPALLKNINSYWLALEGDQVVRWKKWLRRVQYL